VQTGSAKVPEQEMVVVEGVLTAKLLLGGLRDVAESFSQLAMTDRGHSVAGTEYTGGNRFLVIKLKTRV
jgi:hypothetical protein